MYVPYKVQRLGELFSAVARRVVGTVTHVRTSQGVAALTFDDGPHPEFTPALLEILEKHSARATFFMVGEAAGRYPDLVRRVAEEGHAIGNHTWDHPSLPLIPWRERVAQIRACAKAVAPYGQPLFRPPYGDQNLRSCLAARSLGYQIVTWSVVAIDWLDHNPECMAERVLSQLRPGGIALFHDALYTAVEERYRDRRPTLKAVEMILRRLGDRFRFLSLPELFRHGTLERTNWLQAPPLDFLNGLIGPDGQPARRYPQPARRGGLAAP